jgi:hypothetical protein
MFVIVALYVRAGLYKRFVIAHYGDKCLLCRFSITTNLLSSFRFCATFVSSLIIAVFYFLLALSGTIPRRSQRLLYCFIISEEFTGAVHFTVPSSVLANRHEDTCGP